MATTASSAANSASLISHYSVDSSVSRSRRDSSPWMASGDSVAIHDHLAPSVTQDDQFLPPTGKDISDNGDKKPVWNKPSSSSSEVGAVMGAASWPSLPVSGRASSNKSPSREDGTSSSPSPSSSPMQAPQVALVNSSVANATSSENHNINGQRKPFFRRNNNSNTAYSNSSNTAPNAVAREQNQNQRGGTQFRNSNKNRSSYPRRSYEQSGFSHRNNNYNGRGEMQRGFGVMMMGPPSFAATSAQYMAATQYGGPMLYQEYAPHMFMPHPPPDAIAFQPLPMYLPSVDATMLYSKILTQVEYYFSADNLSRDQYLRSCMNHEGWVPVRIIAGFRKLAELTNNIHTILEALRSSQVVEVKGETIRRRGDWDKYLLPREPSSRSGPASAATLG